MQTISRLIRGENITNPNDKLNIVQLINNGQVDLEIQQQNLNNFGKNLLMTLLFNRSVNAEIIEALIKRPVSHSALDINNNSTLMYAIKYNPRYIPLMLEMNEQTFKRISLTKHNAFTYACTRNLCTSALEILNKYPEMCLSTPLLCVDPLQLVINKGMHNIIDKINEIRHNHQTRRQQLPRIDPIVTQPIQPSNMSINRIQCTVIKIEECRVCFEFPTSEYVMLSCGHNYCKQCIDQWTIRNEGTLVCPTCRGR